MLHYFLSYDSKQDAVTTTAHSKSLIELLKNQKKLTSTLSTIWENTDGCADQYICASSLYLMSFLSQRHSIIMYWVIIALGHRKEVVGGINAIYTRCIYQLISNAQLPGSKHFDSHILMYSCALNNDFSMSKQFQKHISKDNLKHGVIYQVKCIKIASKRKWTEI